MLTDKNGRVLLLRKCGANGESHNGFRWPLTVGAEVTAPDWNTKAECGGGLHGLPWACGDWGLLTGTQWMVFSAAPNEVVNIDDAKSKARVARVEHIGTRESCLGFIVGAAHLEVARGEVDARLLPGYGYGYGYGSGYGYGYGDGSGYGSGYGYGYGSGSGYGSGYGDGSGDVVTESAA